VKKHLFILLSLIALFVPSLCVAQMDKALHTSAGFGITITVAAATNKPKLGLLAGLGAGAGKELWDSTQRGHQASARDAIATAIGSGSAYALWKLVLNRHRPVKIADDSTPPADTAVKTTAAAAAADAARPPASRTPPATPAQTNAPAQSVSSGGQR
jgi:uncharacterized protein YfiM (DUF2279 family)